jgi:glutathione S-transferase
MDEHLDGRSFFVGQSLTLADVALYAYTHVAESGGFRLGDYPNVAAWLARVAASPGFVPMDV